MRRTAPAVLAFALMASACGGDSGAATTTTSTTAAATTTASPTTAATTTTTAGEVTAGWFDPIAAGVCFDDVFDGNAFDFTVPAAVVPCDGPHDNEVVAMLDLAYDAYPGEDTLFADTMQACGEAYLDFFGGFELWSDHLSAWTVFPDATDWADGARVAACVVYAPEPIRGTAASAGLTAPGDELAVLHEVGGQLDVWVMDGGTGELTVNVSDSPDSVQTVPPGWGVGGQAVAWAQGSSEPSRRLFGAVPGSEPMEFLGVLDVDSIGSPAVTDAAPTLMAVIAAPDGGEFDVFLYDASDDTLTNLTADNPDRDSTPNWSPDGTKIAYRARHDGNSDVWVMNADGTNKVRLTTDPGFDGDPRWSPDGTQLLFTTDRTGDYEIWIMDADGSNQRNLTNHPADDEYPTWSPDGSLIAFHSNRHSGITVWLMRADGSDQSALGWDAPVGYPTFRP